MSIRMTRVDPEKNMARWYEIDVQPTLFGDTRLSDIGVGSALSVNQKPFGSIMKSEPIKWLAWCPTPNRGVGTLPPPSPTSVNTP